MPRLHRPSSDTGASALRALLVSCLTGAFFLVLFGSPVGEALGVSAILTVGLAVFYGVRRWLRDRPQPEVVPWQDWPKPEPPPAEPSPPADS